MRNLILFILSLAFLSVPSQAAEITVEKMGDDFSIIIIEGEIVRGDAEKFRKIAIENPSALVVLAGPGGLLAEALDIGRVIQIGSYGTYVLNASPCKSSCALIWLAGKKRLIEPGALVGFHSAFTQENGRPITSGFANALIGRYLASLTLSEKATYYITNAEPHEMYWLDTARPGTEGIEYEIIRLESLFGVEAENTQEQPPENDFAMARKRRPGSGSAQTSQDASSSSAGAFIPSIPDRKFGKWQAIGNYSKNEFFGVVSEHKSDGSSLGFLCTTMESCAIAVTTPLSCKPGNSYTINFRARKLFPISMNCMKDGNLLLGDIPAGFAETISGVASVEMEVAGDKTTWNIPISMSGFRESLAYLEQNGMFGQD